MKAIGLRREPQPPMPIVMPLSTPATASSSVVRLSVTISPLASLVPAESLVPLVRARERVPVFVRDTGEVELEGEPLLHPVAGGHGLHVDEVQRLFGRADHPGVLRRDVARHPKGRLV